MLDDEEDGYQLSDGTPCAVLFFWNGHIPALTVARVRLPDGSTIPGSSLMRGDWFYLLGQHHERHANDSASR